MRRTDCISRPKVRLAFGNVKPVRLFTAHALVIVVFGTLGGRGCSSVVALTLVLSTTFRICCTSTLRQGPPAFSLAVSMLDTLRGAADIVEVETRITKRTSVGSIHYTLLAGDCFTVAAFANFLLHASVRQRTSSCLRARRGCCYELRLHTCVMTKEHENWIPRDQGTSKCISKCPSHLQTDRRQRDCDSQSSNRTPIRDSARNRSNPYRKHRRYVCTL